MNIFEREVSIIFKVNLHTATKCGLICLKSVLFYFFLWSIFKQTFPYCIPKREIIKMSENLLFTLKLFTKRKISKNNSANILIFYVFLCLQLVQETKMAQKLSVLDSNLRGVQQSFITWNLISSFDFCDYEIIIHII